MKVTNMQRLRYFAVVSAITDAVALPHQDTTSTDIPAIPVGDKGWRRRPAIFAWDEDDSSKGKWQQEVNDDWHNVT